MKARVKATGEIVEVRLCGEWTNMHGDILPYKTNDGIEYSSHDLSFKIDDERGEPQDYWTRFEHQAAIAAMQGMLSNPAFPEHSQEGYYKTNIKKKKECQRGRRICKFFVSKNRDGE